jgi:hypothetical protein
MWNKEICYTKDILVDGCYDIIVCGGGPAGITASIAASRQGARTCLIERYGFLGGTATASLVNPISEFRKNGKRVIGGIPWEFAKRLEEKRGGITDLPNGNVPFDPEIYKLVAMKMVLENKVDVLLHSAIVDAVMENGTNIGAVLVASSTGIHALRANCFIDCTGNGDLAFFSHMEFQPINPNEWQPGSLCFVLGNVDTDRLEHILPGEVDRKFYNARIRDIFLQYREKDSSFPCFGGPWFCSVLGNGFVSVNATRSICNPLNGWEFSETECRLRLDMFAIHEVLKKYVPEFKESKIVNSGIQVGIRESRRIHGKYILSRKDLAGKANFDDAIAVSAHPIDLHIANGEEQDVTFLQKPVEIPYRCLYADSHKNLLVAGRCISVDRTMLATVRVQAPVMAIGEAAGTAAAMACQQSIAVGAVDGRLLHEMVYYTGKD